MTDRNRQESIVHADDDRGEITMPLDLTRPVDVSVANPNGDVRIRATDRDGALLRYEKHGRPGTRQYDDARLVVEASENRVDVRVEVQGNGGWVTFNPGDLGRRKNPFKRTPRDAWEAESPRVMEEAAKAMRGAGAGLPPMPGMGGMGRGGLTLPAGLSGLMKKK